jgi:hypothetical protein
MMDELLAQMATAKNHWSDRKASQQEAQMTTANCGAIAKPANKMAQH